MKDVNKSQGISRKPNPRLHTNAALNITVIYLVLSLVWIAVSGRIAVIFAPSPAILVHIEMLKSIGFVLVTTILLFILIRSSMLKHAGHEYRIWRLNRIYAMLSGINSAILRIRVRQELLDEACRIATAGGIYLAVGIRLINEDQNTVTTAAGWGDFPEFTGLMKKTVPGNDPYAQAPCAIALREGKSIAINDFGRESPIEPWHMELAANGIKSGAAFPLIADNQVKGVLSLYSGETGIFDAEEIRLLDEITADISLGMEYIEHESQLKYLNYYDVVTGLPNQLILEDRLSQAIARISFHPLRLTAVMSLSIDNFRRITDSTGRHTGDIVLREITAHLGSLLRPGDFVAKTGAHDFSILLVDLANDSDLSYVVNKLLASIPRVIQVNNKNVSLVYRAGIAVHPRDSDNTDELTRYAGQALSAAREQQAVLSYFSRELETRLERSNIIERELQSAIGNNELELYYQPIIEVKNRKTVSAEALLRWQNPHLGRVSPVDFIPAAEESRLIIPVGDWVIRQAARQLIAWAEENLEISVSINVSPYQLRQDNFAGHVLEILKHTGLDLSRHKLSIEITESSLIESVDKVLYEFNILKQAGISIYVDDFGTGYSSLSYLRKFPVDIIKIDREFINGLPHIKEATTLVKGIIGMAKGLGLKVIAEGVETEDQFSVLAELECDFIQGYLFSAPVPAATFSTMNAAGTVILPQ
jgi:diguanylate cyclase (GGDEF)-like protein